MYLKVQQIVWRKDIWNMESWPPRMFLHLFCAQQMCKESLCWIKLFRIFYLSLSALQHKSMQFCGVYPNRESPSHRAIQHLIVSTVIKLLMIRMQKNTSQPWVFLASTIALLSWQWLHRRGRISVFIVFIAPFKGSITESITQIQKKSIWDEHVFAIENSTFLIQFYGIVNDKQQERKPISVFHIKE